MWTKIKDILTLNKKVAFLHKVGRPYTSLEGLVSDSIWSCKVLQKPPAILRTRAEEEISRALLDVTLCPGLEGWPLQFPRNTQTCESEGLFCLA